MSLKGKRQLKARMEAIGGRQFLGRLGLEGVANAKRLVPRRTGNLGRTIRLGTVTDESVQVLAGGERKVGYAAAVEFGSRPHEIRPRRKRVLAWSDSRTLGGRSRGRPTHFAARVRHPGNKAKPYLRPGVMEAVRRAGVDIIVTLWNDAA